MRSITEVQPKAYLATMKVTWKSNPLVTVATHMAAAWIPIGHRQEHIVLQHELFCVADYIREFLFALGKLMSYNHC